MNVAAPNTAAPFGVFERMVAWRYLGARRKEAFISVIAIISFIGIMLGVATLIIVMAVMNGFREEMQSRILGVAGHLVVEATDGSIGDYEDLSTLFATIPGVRTAIPLVEGQVLASGRTGIGNGARVRGIREADIKATALLAQAMKLGTLDGFDGGEGVVIGQNFADTLGVGIGDPVTLVSPDGEESEFGINPRVKAYPVTGIFSLGMAEYDGGVVFMPLGEAQAFFKVDGAANSIELYLDDPYAVDAVKPVVTETAGRNLKLTDWREANKTLFDALQVERNVMFMVLTLIVLVAALNIVSGLVMMVKDKGADIGILRTIGATRAAVLRVFVMAGSAIGIVGTFGGVILGVLVCLNIDAVRVVFGFFAGGASGGEAGFLSRMPARMDAGETIAIVLMALLLTFVASVFPAWRAARLDPVEALRSA